MKKILLAFGLLLLSQNSHAFLSGCGSSDSVYTSMFQVLSDSSCLGGLALKDKSGQHCTYLESSYVTSVKPGYYRGCLKTYSNGVAITAIEDIEAE